MQTRDDRGAFEFVPRQTPGLDERFPVLATSNFNTGMRLIEADGAIHVGADAVYGIARHLRGWRRWAWLYRVPGLCGLSRLAYGLVARNRQRLGKTCDDSGACRIEQPRD